ncbi:PRC-barrel domain-containing protein [Desulfonatronum sp. SC1]|uniref:PRC-barrel domain-containing protein n=1 Tax=Desulfonatronum sp. SC1 TaxID=2109626 RepID=UPI001304CB28|nr:PRC-barrel domain-containing protein [Desulfonatronum sp. SC1]
MKALLASIIIGLLSLSPAFAQSTVDTKQKETDQKRSEQTGEQKVLPKYDNERKVTTDPARPHRATEVEPQEGYQRVSSDLITADDLKGASVYDTKNESVADVKEVLITPEGKIDRLIVDVGGFLGMGARSVSINVNEADIHKDAKDDIRVYIPMSEEELRQMPEYKK